jgi:hypothetical protein
VSPAKKQALALRDLAGFVAKTKGVIVGPDLYIYQDMRIRVEYRTVKPHALDVFRRGDLELKVPSVVWNESNGDGSNTVVILHRGGIWEDSLRRLAKAV